MPRGHGLDAIYSLGIYARFLANFFESFARLIRL